MSVQQMRRPTGFAPTEMSALVNETIVAQHAEEAAFLWTLRDRATGEPHYSLQDLAKLDERVDAHLDGLRIASESGWRLCKGNLITGDGEGEVFALAVLAFGAGQRESMSDALQSGCKSKKHRRGLEAALGWLDYPQVSQWLDILLDAQLPLHRSVAIAAFADHREDPGDRLAEAVDDGDPTLRRCALRAVGQLKRDDLIPAVLSHLADEDPDCAFWAAWSAALLGERRGLPRLLQSVEQQDAFSGTALQLGLRAMPLEDGRNWLSGLAKQSTFDRVVVLGIGIVGDPTSVPWLLRKMENPELARVAGEAFSMITGADVVSLELDQRAPAPKHQDGDSESDVAEPDHDSNLPVPAANLASAWWGSHEARFSPGIRYLVGRPTSRQSAVDVLTVGRQRQRAAAAIELALIDHRAPLFNVSDRAERQRRKLALVATERDK